MLKSHISCLLEDIVFLPIFGSTQLMPNVFSRVLPISSLLQYRVFATIAIIHANSVMMLFLLQLTAQAAALLLFVN